MDRVGKGIIGDLMGCLRTCNNKHRAREGREGEGEEEEGSDMSVTAEEGRKTER